MSNTKTKPFTQSTICYIDPFKKWEVRQNQCEVLKSRKQNEIDNFIDQFERNYCVYVIFKSNTHKYLMACPRNILEHVLPKDIDMIFAITPRNKTFIKRYLNMGGTYDNAIEVPNDLQIMTNTTKG